MEWKRRQSPKTMIQTRGLSAKFYLPRHKFQLQPSLIFSSRAKLLTPFSNGNIMSQPASMRYTTYSLFARPSCTYIRNLQSTCNRKHRLPLKGLHQFCTWVSEVRRFSTRLYSKSKEACRLCSWSWRINARYDNHKLRYHGCLIKHFHMPISRYCTLNSTCFKKQSVMRLLK